MPSILIVENRSNSQELLSTLLEPLGHDVTFAKSPKAALDSYKSNRQNIVLVDNSDADQTGIKLFGELRRIDPSVKVIMMDALPDIPKTVAALRMECFDYLRKPLKVAEFVSAINRGLDISDAGSEQAEAVVVDGHIPFCPALVGEHAEIAAAREYVGNLTPAKAPSTILLQGPFGSGKIQVAQQIHRLARPPGTPFVLFDCRVARPEKLDEQLLGADGNGGTVMKQARGGTLVIHNLPALTIDFQRSLARTIRVVAPHILVVATSEDNLEEDLDETKVAIELYYHISLTVINLPSLRERMADIPTLVTHIVRHAPEVEDSRRRATFEPAALEKLQSLDWTGNLDELVGVVVHTVMQTKKVSVGEDDLVIPTPPAAGD